MNKICISIPSGTTKNNTGGSILKILKISAGLSIKSINLSVLKFI